MIFRKKLSDSAPAFDRIQILEFIREKFQPFLKSLTNIPPFPCLKIVESILQLRSQARYPISRSYEESWPITTVMKMLMLMLARVSKSSWDGYVWAIENVLFVIVLINLDFHGFSYNWHFGLVEKQLLYVSVWHMNAFVFLLLWF